MAKTHVLCKFSREKSTITVPKIKQITIWFYIHNKIFLKNMQNIRRIKHLNKKTKTETNPDGSVEIHLKISRNIEICIESTSFISRTCWPETKKMTRLAGVLCCCLFKTLLLLSRRDAAGRRCYLSLQKEEEKKRRRRRGKRGGEKEREGEEKREEGNDGRGRKERRRLLLLAMAAGFAGGGCC